MNVMSRICRLLICILAILIPAMSWGNNNAISILDKAASKIRSAKSLIAEYTLTSGGQTVNGILTLAGDCFQLSSPQVRSWYDGKTQWTYSSHIGEVNITEPTSEDLAQVNPFSILKSFSSNYTASTQKSAKGTSTVLLKAKKKNADISSVLVTVNNSTGYPSAIRLSLDGGQTVNIKINSVIPGGLLPISRFRYNPKDYPGINVVDLR